MLTKREGLWSKVVWVRYRDKALFSTQGGNSERDTKGSLWWRNVLSLDDNVPSKDGWVSSDLSRIVGSGSEVSFWNEVWVWQYTFRSRFNRLYLLFGTKEGAVGEMGLSKEGRWTWSLPWRRRLSLWDEDIREELMAVLENHIIQQNKGDG